MTKSKNGPQSWQNCDEEIRSMVLSVANSAERVFGGNLMGVYLHGSLAMGSFYRPKSDIDVLIVVGVPLSKKEHDSFIDELLKISEIRPIIGDIEVSVVTSETAAKASFPAHYEFHFSEANKERLRAQGSKIYGDAHDADLISHFMATKHRGIALLGKPIDAVFGNVALPDFEKAILNDLAWILSGENILTTPFYSILNICRSLQLVRSKAFEVLSKEEGARWALREYPEFAHIINDALEAYRSDKQVTSKTRRTNDSVWNREELLHFRNFARIEMEKYRPGFAWVKTKVVFITGASGSGKTAILTAFSKQNPSITCLSFDSIGVPSPEEMIAKYGSEAEWQRQTMLEWIHKIRTEYLNRGPVLFEGQCRIQYIQEGLHQYDLTGVKIVLIDCSDAARHERLAINRIQPELSNDRMMKWANFLREESVRLSVEVLDTTEISIATAVQKIESMYC